MKQDFMFSSESVTAGHPDKLCDLISDAVVDRFLQQDPFSRINTECAVAEGILFIAARFSSEVNVDIPEVARQVIAQVGYERPDFNAQHCSVMTSFTESTQVAQRPPDEREMSEAELDAVTAKNQANVFGFACRQTEAMLPLPIWLAHKLSRRLAEVRSEKLLSYLAPDGSVQVGVEFRNRQPVRIHAITLVASQYQETGHDCPTLADDLRECVIDQVFLDEELKPDVDTQILINPDGPFITGGPSLHSGLTGRKNAIDTYGEYSRHSGSALSGKDPTRIDRVGAYAARYAAKNVVAAGLADECEVQLSYFIGLSQPRSIQVETFGTGRIADDKIAERVREHFDFRPAGVIRSLNLRFAPQLHHGNFYRSIAAYGHMGRLDLKLPWEMTDKADALC